VTPADAKSLAVTALAVAVLVLGIAYVIPPVAQDQAYHAFADQRALGDIPHAADVLSNLAFLVVGGAGIAMLLSPRARRFHGAARLSLWLVAAGLVLTALGSAWYHLAPDDAGLAIDRLPMTFVFAGILGMLFATRVGPGPAYGVIAALLPLGVASVAIWRETGNLALYVVLQFGGLTAIAGVLLATRDRRRRDPVPWLWLFVFYFAAKIAELADARVYAATGGFVSGHTLKHVLAGIGAAVVLLPLFPRRPAP